MAVSGRASRRPFMGARSLCGVAACLASGAVAVPGRYSTSEQQTKTFAWTAPKRTVAQAFDEAFPSGSWVDFPFVEGGSMQMTREKLVTWVQDDLLNGPSPFADFGGAMPVPWPAPSHSGDQLGEGQWVSYSRRQLCFLIAKSLTGSGTCGYANGLLRWLEQPGGGGCLPRTNDFGRSLLVALGACAADPGLAGGNQGPVVVVAKSKQKPEVSEPRIESQDTQLSEAGLRLCQYDDGVGGALGDLPGIPRVPAEDCMQPPPGVPGRDFMSGGTVRVAGQAIQDISAEFLGGYVFGNACGLGGGQDERLMTYMPEVAALAFFLSQEWERPQLRQPAWILGARMLFTGLDGTAHHDKTLVRDATVPLTSDLVTINLAGSEVQVSGSRPFLAFMSENQGFLGNPETAYNTQMARLNKSPLQRAVDAGLWHSFDKQVRAWYGSVALTSYHPDVQPALLSVVKSIGTGPWFSGLWWGDSQLGLLAVWLGHAIAAKTWAAQGGMLPVDFYVYSAFTENPGNQCFVHSAANCHSCLARCTAAPPGGYWLPSYAYFGGSNPCVPSIAECGQKGIEHLAAAYQGKSAAALWRDVEDALRADPMAKRSVFDTLLAGPPTVLLP